MKTNTGGGMVKEIRTSITFINERLCRLFPYDVYDMGQTFEKPSDLKTWKVAKSGAFD